MAIPTSKRLEGAMSNPHIDGEFAPAFAPLAKAFEQNFVEHGEIGASLCVYRDGEPVVDLWGGHADGARTRPWEKDTLVNVWSTTKGVLALCVARLMDQGRISYDAPVARYWPEFAAGGKADVTIAQLFSHQAGICGPSRQLSEAELLNTIIVGDVLAAEAPHWPVGTRSGYHALSIGPLGDGLFMRVTGKTVGQYFRDEIAAPCGIDFHMGLPLTEEARVAEIVHDGNPESGGHDSFNEFQRLAQVNIPVRAALANLRAWRTQGTPSAGGQGNARGLAHLYGALAANRKLGGVELLSAEALKAATRIQIENEDFVLRFPMSWGVGFALNKLMGVYGPNPESFGHHGWGGSFAFADPAKRIGVAYAMNFMREPMGAMDPRFGGLVSALYASV